MNFSKNILKEFSKEDINECVKIVSQKLKISFVEIQKIINDYFFQGDCKKLKTKNECDQNVNCFYLKPYNCLSRQIPDANEINKDPDAYVKKYLGKIDDLKKMVEIASYLYYNYDGGGLNDNAYDALEYHLKKRERLRGRLYEKIGAPPIERIREPLKYYMPSLLKMKPGEKRLTHFLENTNKLVWSEKLDGVSGMLVYKNGVLERINTRGNGIEGGNVTYLKDYVKYVPASVKVETLVIRGEFIISKKVFEEKYKNNYSNPRSFVSGKINSGFISEYVKDIEFVGYNIINISSDKPKTIYSNFELMEKLNFKVVDHGIIDNPLLFDLVYKYKTQRKTSEYNIDGLVISKDFVVENQTEIGSDEIESRNPDNIFAFKMLLKEQLRKTEIINIDWGISRYGRYVPVAIYKAVYIDGVRLHRATAHNAGWVKSRCLGEGTKVDVVRSGDVIPQIKYVDVDCSIKPIYPNDTYEWKWMGKDIILEHIEDNKDVQIKRIVHFLTTIGVNGVKEKITENLWDIGIKTAIDISEAKADELKKAKRVGIKTANKIEENIKKQIRNVPPDRLIVASTVFQMGIGTKILKKIFYNVPNILLMDNEQMENKIKNMKMKGLGPKTKQKLIEGIPKFKKYVKELGVKTLDYYVKLNEKFEKEGYNKKIYGKNFVLTGFMSTPTYKIEDLIYENKGEIVARVNKEVEAVIAASINNISKKMEDAHALGIKVYTVSEFYEHYKK